MEIRKGRATDVEVVRSLLHACRLPLGGFPEDLETFFVATAGGGLLGVAGLEVHASCGLLRSVAVAPVARRRAIASRLCATVEARAATLGLEGLFLLTETAEAFFRSRGYAVVDREAAPADVAASKEFSTLCPASAVLMVRRS